MDYVKEAFQKVRQDIEILKQEFSLLKESMVEICEIVQKIESQKEKDASTNRQTDRHIIPTDRYIIPTDNLPFSPLNAQNRHISIGNDGVPTDRQTNQQTNQQTHFFAQKPENSIAEATNMLNSLDNIKKEIRIKFKRLTEQELLVFSVIYQLDEEDEFTDYKTLSQKLNLSESSIRDYVGRLIKKGIPVDKEKINNKNIKLSISPNLKKIASLSSIMQLRDL
jgi:hypothetical protein